MNELHIKSQAEFDAIPNDYDGRIFIEFGEPYNRAVINRRFRYSVVAWGNSSVVAWENSSVEAWENSSVVAWENSSVEARGNSSVVAWGNSSVEAWENSSVVARGNSSVEARGNSYVEAWGNSSVEARGNSSVEARGNSQICDRSRSHDINTSGNARIVYDPRNAEEYINLHELEHDEKTVRLFKAVHKTDKGYAADYDGAFRYEIGKEAVADYLDDNVNMDCGHGIHMAFKEWCVSYGAGWNDMAILELETEIAGLVVPVNGAGKVRAAKATVIREVPLKECGLYGRVLAKRRQK